jgi:hypothetical protein
VLFGLFTGFIPGVTVVTLVLLFGANCWWMPSSTGSELYPIRHALNGPFGVSSFSRLGGFDANHSVNISWWFRADNTRLAPRFGRCPGQLSIEAERCTNQRKMGKRLREVAQLMAVPSNLFRK